jgi:hypothetical protein
MNNKKLIFIIFLLFCFSRIIIYLSGIYPNLLFGYWQTLDYKLLSQDLFSSLIYLHSEPILWNLLLGVTIKIFKENLKFVAYFFYFYHVILSFFIILYSILISDYFRSSVKVKFFLAVFLILSPNLIFFENWIFYTHTTCFLFFQLTYFLLRFFKNNELKFEFLIYLNLLLLTTLWKAFHPLIIFLFFLIFLLLSKNLKLRRSVIVFSLFFIISIFPMIKNKIIFGFFSNGSLIGLNLTQTIPSKSKVHFIDIDNNVNNCTFDIKERDEYNYFIQFKKNKDDYNHPSLVGNLSGKNNLGGIYKSKECTKVFFDYITENSFQWLISRFYNLLHSHGKPAIDHGFAPLNWDKTRLSSFIKFMKSSDFLKYLMGATLIIYMLIIYIFFIYRFYFSNEKTFIKKSLFCIFILYSYLVFVGHFFNGWEQERFLYTGFVLQIIFINFLIKKFIKK